MTPGELIEASNDLLVNMQDELSKYARQAPECISQLLALFGEQSEQIKKLRAELTGCSPNMAQFVATPLENKIIWHDIDLERAKEQIKSLQSALTKERFWKIWREGKHTSVEAATELAKKQLRAEMPVEMACACY
ncbi:hypothetical protein M0R72_21155 [Candidatus Pacearchaeota archaeon]|jgi:hypothetical protein|nr:hypothetical protein [Candidatus Pacearchaeota archaeon]